MDHLQWDTLTPAIPNAIKETGERPSGERTYLDA